MHARKAGIGASEVAKDPQIAVDPLPVRPIQASDRIPERPVHPNPLKNPDFSGWHQIAKRERIVSFLAEKDRRSVRGAITRAFQLPEASEAHDALLRVHATLLQRNQSAARWLLQDLERTLTLHPTGLYEILSPSLRTTRSLVHTARQLFRQLRNLRHWLPPETRRAEWALWLLEKEARMRRMEHAGHLLPMRAALFTEDGRPRAS